MCLTFLAVMSTRRMYFFLSFFWGGDGCMEFSEISYFKKLIFVYLEFHIWMGAKGLSGLGPDPVYYGVF